MDRPRAGQDKTADRCAFCGRHRDESVLEKCPVCYRLFCRACGQRWAGKFFCSRQCGDYFFFGDEDD